MTTQWTDDGAMYTLRNAEELAANHPTTFYIPTRQQRLRIEPGEFVKVVFVYRASSLNGPDGEMMWLEVLRRDGDAYIGRLDNLPVQPGLVGVTLDAEVRFGPEHVYEIYRGKRSGR